MKLVIQRVLSASVTKKETGEIVGKIDKGLFVLLGIKKGDANEHATKFADKLAKLRIMPDDQDKMNLSVVESSKQVLIVSQFTLNANTKDGNRPSFGSAEEPSKAKEIYECFISELKNKGLEVQTGSFGDYMNIEVSLDGPVTIILET